MKICAISDLHGCLPKIEPREKVLFILGNHECGVEGHEIEYRNMFPYSYKATILIYEEYEYLSNEWKNI